MVPNLALMAFSLFLLLSPGMPAQLLAKGPRSPVLRVGLELETVWIASIEVGWERRLT